MITDPLFYVAAIPAVTLLGLGKGGFAGVGALALPLMALVAPPLVSAAVLLPILIIQDVVSVWAFRRQWDSRNLAILLPGCIAGVIFGTCVAASVPDYVIGMLVGLICLIFAAYRLARERLGPPEPAPARVIPGLAWGFVSGFASLISHAGGPPFQVYVLPQRLPRDVLVGTTAIFFALMNWMKVPPFIMLGQFTAENLATSAVLVPLAMTTTWAGVLFVRRVPLERFYTIIYVIMLASGCKLLWDGSRAWMSGWGA